MTTRPNRSKIAPSPGRNPKPSEIYEARLRARLTQRAAAEVVYVTLNAWQKWESGHRRMSAAVWELFRAKTWKPKATDLESTS